MKVAPVAEGIGVDGRGDVDGNADEVDAPLQTAQAALHAAEQVLRRLVVGLLELALEAGHHCADNADDCDFERSERHY